MVEADPTTRRSPTSEMPHVRHPIHRRFDAEDLVRLRRSSERRRYAASQRLGRIDPNPHQIDAVMFALRRIPEGGCILADELGLGKTIEAGLVIAQVLAEGFERILVVVPKPLLGQWQDELYTLFGISALEAADARCEIAAPGVFLVGREYAGSASGSQRNQVRRGRLRPRRRCLLSARPGAAGSGQPRSGCNLVVAGGDLPVPRGAAPTAGREHEKDRAQAHAGDATATARV